MRRWSFSIAILVAFIAVGATASLAACTVRQESAAPRASGVGAVKFLDLAGTPLEGDYHVAPDASSGTVWIVHPATTWDEDPELAAVTRYTVLEYDTATGDVVSHKLPLETRRYIGGDVFTPGAFTIHDGADKLWIASYDAFGYFDAVSREFVPVTMPAQERLPASEELVPAGGDARARWRDQRVVSMALETDGTVWLARDYARGLLRYAVASSRFDVLETPGEIEVPGYLRVVGDEILLAEYRRPSQPPQTGARRGWSAVSADGAKWRRLETTDYIAASDGARALIVRPEGSPGVATIGEGERAPRPELADAGGSPVGAITEPWRDLLAAGPDGDVWYVKDRLDLAMYNLSSGVETVYALPRVESARGGGAPGNGGDSGVSPFLAPIFTSAAVDAEGNLWFSYITGDAHVGVAYR
ncbi:MAG: hypothetical protein U1E08_07635 [Coriobacteriia bacterium]|nr:hypothetical protein [Coriobacteriia bacterium]